MKNSWPIDSQIKDKDASLLQREQLPAANRTPGQYQLDGEGALGQLFAQI